MVDSSVALCRILCLPLVRDSSRYQRGNERLRSNSLMRSMTNIKIGVLDRDQKRRNEISRIASKFAYSVPFADLDELTGRWPDGAILLVHDSASLIKCCQEAGQRAKKWLPIIGYSESPSSDRIVTAMRMGVMDYFDWPCCSMRLQGAVEAAQSEASAVSGLYETRISAANKISELSMREREVLDAFSDGFSNREIGQQLGISPRTVEVHRANIISKLDVGNSILAARLRYDAASLS